MIMSTVKCFEELDIPLIQKFKDSIIQKFKDYVNNKVF
jgi:hypothetical protein